MRFLVYYTLWRRKCQLELARNVKGSLFPLQNIATALVVGIIQTKPLVSNVESCVVSDTIIVMYVFQDRANLISASRVTDI